MTDTPTPLRIVAMVLEECATIERYHGDAGLAPYYDARAAAIHRQENARCKAEQKPDALALPAKLRARYLDYGDVLKAADSIEQLHAALCWAMDEIDALSNLKAEFAYPQGMAMVGRSDQLDAYIKACEARGLTIAPKPEPKPGD